MDSLMEEGRGKGGEKAPGKKSSPSPPLPLAFPLLLSLHRWPRPSIGHPFRAARPRPPAARLPDRRRARPAFPLVGRVLKEVQIQFVSRARADGWTDGRARASAPPIDALWIHHQSKAAGVAGGEQGREEGKCRSN